MLSVSQSSNHKPSVWHWYWEAKISFLSNFLTLDFPPGFFTNTHLNSPGPPNFVPSSAVDKWGAHKLEVPFQIKIYWNKSVKQINDFFLFWKIHFYLMPRSLFPCLFWSCLPVCHKYLTHHTAHQICRPSPRQCHTNFIIIIISGQFEHPSDGNGGGATANGTARQNMPTGRGGGGHDAGKLFHSFTPEREG